MGTSGLDAIAKKLARDIFSLGDEPKSPAKRMQYKGGTWPFEERGQGGIGEEQMASFIERRLKHYLSSNAEDKPRD